MGLRTGGEQDPHRVLPQHLSAAGSPSMDVQVAIPELQLYKLPRTDLTHQFKPQQLLVCSPQAPEGGY